MAPRKKKLEEIFITHYALNDIPSFFVRSRGPRITHLKDAFQPISLGSIIAKVWFGVVDLYRRTFHPFSLLRAAEILPAFTFTCGEYSLHLL